MPVNRNAKIAIQILLQLDFVFVIAVMVFSVYMGSILTFFSACFILLTGQMRFLHSLTAKQSNKTADSLSVITESGTG